MANIPASLKEKLRDGKVVPFVGAGVSRQVKSRETALHLFPTWGEFLQKARTVLEAEFKAKEAQKIADALTKTPPDYLNAVQIARDSLTDWFEFVEETFNPRKEKAAENSLELARLVWALGSDFLITTNIDKVLRWSCPHQDDLAVLSRERVELGTLAKKGQADKPTVWYLHGSVNDKEHIVFTREQYEKFYDEKQFAGALKTLDVFLTQKSFLFIGFSLDDIYFLEQLKYINDIYGGASSRHFVLLHKDEVLKSKIPEYINIIEFSDFGRSLLETVLELSLFAPRTLEKKREEGSLPKTFGHFYKRYLGIGISVLTLFIFLAVFAIWKTGSEQLSNQSRPKTSNVTSSAAENQSDNQVSPLGNSTDIQNNTVRASNSAKQQVGNKESPLTGKGFPIQKNSISRAKDLLDKAEFDKAIQECNKILKTNPKNTEALKLKQDIIRTKQIVEKN